MFARFVLGIFLLMPLSVFALSIPTLAPSLAISASPSSPAAGDTVTLRAENLPSPGATTFLWRVNGAVVDQGVGVSAITITAGVVGSETRISVIASQGGSVLGEVSFVLRPAEVDIVWEGDTYTPPFFEGLPLPNPSSTLTLLAIPSIVENGVRVSANNLVYTWYVNGGAVPVASGFGRQSVVVRSPQFSNPFSVGVMVETLSGAVSASKAISITPVDPVVVVYEKAPLLGVRFERAINDSFALPSDEVTFIAFPLYVGNPTSPSYEWRLNGSVVPGNGGTGREITLRREGVGSGRYTLSFSFENVRALFERASAAFSVSF